MWNRLHTPVTGEYMTNAFTQCRDWHLTLTRSSLLKCATILTPEMRHYWQAWNAPLFSSLKYATILKPEMRHDSQAWNAPRFSSLKCATILKPEMCHCSEAWNAPLFSSLKCATTLKPEIRHYSQAWNTPLFSSMKFAQVVWLKQNVKTAVTQRTATMAPCKETNIVLCWWTQVIVADNRSHNRNEDFRYNMCFFCQWISLS